MTLRGACDAASELVAVWFWATLIGTFYCAVHIVLPILYAHDSTALFSLRDCKMFGFVFAFLNLRLLKSAFLAPPPTQPIYNLHYMMHYSVCMIYYS